MRVLTPHFVRDKTVLLRYDFDVPLIEENGRMEIADDFRLSSGLPTLFLCLQYAKKVILMGHLGRPEGEDPKYSVAPIVEWLDTLVPDYQFAEDELQVLENLRFEKGEDECDINYAKELASLGDCFVMEAFAAHHKAASTIMVPELIPSAAGFHFDHEVRTIRDAKLHPQKPLISVIGGAKIEDKLNAIKVLSEISDVVLVGGKLPHEIKEQGTALPGNVVVAEMNDAGLDLSHKDMADFRKYIVEAKQVIWSGPMGKFEEGQMEGSKAVAEAIIQSDAFSIVGGGDTTDFLSLEGIDDQFSFVSTGGGAMLELLTTNTLPTIEALQD